MKPNALFAPSRNRWRRIGETDLQRLTPLVARGELVGQGGDGTVGGADAVLRLLRARNGGLRDLLKRAIVLDNLQRHMLGLRRQCAEAVVTGLTELKAMVDGTAPILA